MQCRMARIFVGSERSESGSVSSGAGRPFHGSSVCIGVIFVSLTLDGHQETFDFLKRLRLLASLKTKYVETLMCFLVV